MEFSTQQVHSPFHFKTKYSKFYWFYSVLKRFFQKAFFVSLLLLISPYLEAKQNWKFLAKRFTGESDLIRQSSINQIKKIPNLENLLKKELSGPDKFIVLDVIATLKLTGLLPELIKYSEYDETGFFYHALNALMTTTSLKHKLSQLYYSRLLNVNTPAAAKVVILDTLGRLNVSLSSADLKYLLLDESLPEVRSAALYYLRTQFTNKTGQERDLILLKEVLDTEPYQIRLQALYFFSELNTTYQSVWLPFLKSCLTDKNPEVKQFCFDLYQRSNK